MPEPPATKSPHGVRRRMSQMVLPQEAGGPISWDTASEMEAVPEQRRWHRRASGPRPGTKPSGYSGKRGRHPHPAGPDSHRRTGHPDAGQLLRAPASQGGNPTRFDPSSGCECSSAGSSRETAIPVGRQDELTFHNTLTQIFNSVRDLHTGYQLRAYRNHIAYLPFEVASCYVDDQRRYLVTRVVPAHVRRTRV